MEERFIEQGVHPLVDNKNLFILSSTRPRAASGVLSDNADKINPVFRDYYRCGCVPLRAMVKTAIGAIVLAIMLHPSLANATGPLAITEIAAFEPQGHEWIKVENIGSDPIDLTAWKFFEDDTNHGIKEFRGGPLVPPGESAVVAQNAETTATDKPDYAGLIFDSAWGSLVEKGELIGLRDPSGIMVESFTYPPASQGLLVRKDPNAPPDDPANWSEPAPAASPTTPNAAEPMTAPSSTATEVIIEQKNDPQVIHVPIYEYINVPITKTIVKTIKVQDTTIIVVEVPHIYERTTNYLPAPTPTPTKADPKLKEPKQKSKKVSAAATKKTKPKSKPVMTVEGEVLERSRTSIVIKPEGGDEIYVKVPKTAAYRAAGLREGDRVKITGISGEEKDGSLSLKLRGPKDIKVLASASSTPAIVPEPVRASAPKQKQHWPYLGAAGLGSVLLGGHMVREMKKKKKQPPHS